jgi:hypothetical protein
VHELLTYNFDCLLEEALDAIGRRYTRVDRDSFPVDGELPIRHVHGWLEREPSDAEWLVFAEDEFHARYADPFDWSNVVQLNAFSQRCCLFVGLSMDDPDLRRLLDAVSGRKPGRSRAPHFALLPRTDDAAIERSLLDLRASAGEALDEGSWHAVLERVRWMRELADLSKAAVLEQLGVNVIWFEGFDELPELLVTLE